MRTLWATLPAGIFLLGVSNALAHHSYAAEFDSDSPRTIEGVLREVWFKNRHVRYYVAVEKST